MKPEIVELEGLILKDLDRFTYFMLVAFEASGLIRFAILLMLWPVIRLLELLAKEDVGLRLTIFVAVTGIRMTDIEYVSRAVLPKFYMDDLDVHAWRTAFSQNGKRVVVVTKTPRLMVEMFLKEHLSVDHVIGTELVVNRFGFATGFATEIGLFPARVAELFADADDQSVQHSSSIGHTLSGDNNLDDNPIPVIFHDGRLAKRPKPSTALVILLWYPIGFVVAIIRIAIVIFLPMFTVPHQDVLVGTVVKVKGNTYKPSRSGSSTGVLFVCNHRTLSDPISVSHAVGRRIPVVTYSLSRISEMVSPIPTRRLTRDREVDARMIKTELEKGDLVICPEGTTCREPFLLRFSGLFAELTEHIVPVAVNHKPCLFYATTARGWKALDSLYYFMDPISIYEVSFLPKLEAETTCSAGKSSHEVANYVQSVVADALGFKCTDYTRKDKYRLLAGNHGIVPTTGDSCLIGLIKMVKRFYREVKENVSASGLVMPKC